MASIVGASRLAAILTLDIKPFLRNTEIALKRLERFRAQAQSLASTLGRSIGVAFGLIGVQAVKVAAEFDEIESQLRAISGLDSVDNLVDEAQRLGRATKFTSTEVLGLALELRKLGFESDAAEGALRTSVKISQVFGGTLDRVGVSIAETARQFKEFTTEAQDFERIGDIFAVAFQNSALDVNNLSGALKNVGSVANIAGYDLEQTVSLLAALANAGQKAERGGTRLKTTMVRLGQELGFSGKEMAILQSESLDVGGVFDLLKNRAGLAGAVIKEFGFEIELMRARLEDAGGALDAMNEGLEDRLFIQAAKVTNAFNEMGRTLGQALLPFVTELASFVEDAAKSFGSADKETKSFVGRMVAMSVIVPVVTATIAALLAAITALATGPGAVVAGLSLLLSSFIATKLRAIELEGRFRSLLEVQDRYNKLLADTGGDLQKASLPVLEQQLKDVQEELAGATSLLDAYQKRLVSLASNRVSNTLNRAQVSGPSDEELDITSKIEAIRGSIFDQVVAQLNLQAAIIKKEETLYALAEERFEAAKALGFELQENRSITQNFVDDFEKANQKIQAAVALFGSMSDEAAAVQSYIRDLENVDLSKIKDLGFTEATNILELLPLGELKNQRQLVGTITSALTEMASKATLTGLVDTAEKLRAAAREYEESLKKLDSAIAIQEAIDRKNTTTKFNQDLLGLGLITEDENLKAKLQATRTLIDSLLAADDSSTADQISGLVLLLNKLQREIDFRDIQSQLDAVLNAPQTLEEARAELAGNVGQPLAASELLGLDIKRVEFELAQLFKASQDFQKQEDKENALKRFQDKYLELVALLQAQELQVEIEELQASFEELDKSLSDIKYEESLGLVESADVISAEIDVIVAKLQELRNASAENFDPVAIEDLEGQLQSLLKESKALENAQNVLSFFQDQLNFLGEAFLQASQNGENFFDVLKKSFLDTFRALVAKLITLIALYGLLAIVSGGSTAAAGGIRGAAASAMGANFGSFLGENLLGLNRSLATSGPTQGRAGEQAQVKLSGTLSGDTIVIANQRGARAIDRTFG